MANTYKLIASSTVGSGGAANIEFTSISGTFTDLLLKLSLRSADSGTGIEITFNSDTASNYKYIRFYATGSGTPTTNKSTSATKILSNAVNQNTYTVNTFANADIYIPNYTSSNGKTISIDAAVENNATTGWDVFTAGHWTGSAAITSIKLISEGGNFGQYSTAYLYGIKNS